MARANRTTNRLALCALLAACGDDPGAPAARVERLFVQPFAGCLLASPLRVESRGAEQVLATSSEGTIAALDPETGAVAWSVALPARGPEVPNVAATPGLAGGGDKLVVAWQRVLADFTRTEHLVDVVDLEARALDPAFPRVTLAAVLPDADGTGVVPFLAANAYSRAAIAVARPPDRPLGLAYVGYGNIRDIQPWHGWVFELDLDAWAQGGAGAALSSVLLTTPESDCGPPGKSGSDDMICGGGVWAPAGPQVFPAAGGGFELIVPTGNGQLDLTRRDYANTLMRTGEGLAFDPACDPAACAGFDPIDPSPACIASCADLFIPRLLPGQPLFDPPDGRCEGKTFFECYALLDYDLGANTPARVELAGGPTVFVLPAKDGGVYLIDADHMGTLYDRRQIMEVCGSDGGSCSANWAGMMVTQPEVTAVDGAPVVLIPTFVHDTNHPAGLVALRIGRAEGRPVLEPMWEAPPFSSAEALARFRRHDGRVAITEWRGETHAFLVDVAGAGERGTMLAVRVRDGEIVARTTLDGRGQRYVKPLILGDTIYLTSCASDAGPGQVEAYRLIEP